MEEKIIDFITPCVASRERKSKARGEKHQKRFNYIHPWENVNVKL